MKLAPARFPLLGCTFLGLGLGACVDRPISAVTPETTVENVTEIDVSANRDIDILFVIDDSNSMNEEQALLTENFAVLVEQLTNIKGGLPNIHLAVVSSDMGAQGKDFTSDCKGFGDGGALQTTHHVENADKKTETVTPCDMLTQNFLSDELNEASMERVRNYSGSLADAFSCIAKVGSHGCGFEQHLESMKAALDGRNPDNKDFLRPNAKLAVIFIADEDDCSAKDQEFFGPTEDFGQGLGVLTSYRCWEFGVRCSPDLPQELPAEGSAVRTECAPRTDSPYINDVSEYVTFLRSLKEDPSSIFVAGITGGNPIEVKPFLDGDTPSLEKSCYSKSDEDVNAAPATRLSNFIASFPLRNAEASVCEDSYAPAMKTIAEEMGKIIQPDFCLEAPPADSDPNTPGLQEDCVISQFKNRGENNQEETLIRSCAKNGDTPPCYRFEQTDTCDFQLVIDRGEAALSDEVQLVARCTGN